MAKSDGSVIIDTQMDTSGFTQGSVNVQSAFGKMSTAAQKFDNTIKNVFSSGESSNGMADSIKDQSEDILNILNNTEKSAKSKAASIAAIYRQQGMSQQEAFKKAWEQIERDSSSGTKKVKKDMEGMGKKSKSVGKEMEKNLTSSIAGSVKKIGSLIASVFAIRKLVQFGKEAIELGSDLAEVQNVVDVTFEDLNEEVNQFAKNAIKQFGLSETSAKQYSSTMGAMLKSMGFTKREAADMGMAMAGLAGDIASFYNLDTDEAFAKIRSGISGETEPLKQLGINLSVANLEQYALTQGITKSYNAMTQQEQAMLRYNYLLSVTADAQGDFARTSDSWANQTRILSEQFNSLKATIGQGLINVFTPVIKVLNVLIERLAVVANSFKAFTELITGNKAEENSGFANTAEGIEGVANAATDAAEATEEAEKAQKGYLSGLDEMRQYSDDSDTSGGLVDTSGVNINGVNVDYGKAAEGNTIFERMAEEIAAVIDKLRELGGIFADGFKDGFGDNLNSFKEIKNSILGIEDSLKGLFSDPDVTSGAQNFVNSFVETLGTLTGSVSSVALSVVNTFTKALNKYISKNNPKIKKYFVKMFDIGTDINNTLTEASSGIGDILSNVIDDTATQSITEHIISIFGNIGMAVNEVIAGMFRDTLNIILQPIMDNKEEITQTILGILDPINTALAALDDYVSQVTEGIVDLYENHIQPFMDDIAEGISNMVETFLDAWNTYIQPILDDMGDRFQEVMDGPIGNAWESFKDFVAEAIDTIHELWDFIQPFVNWIIETIVRIVAPVIHFLGNTFMNAFETIGNIVGGFFDVLTNVIRFIKDVFKGDWDAVWEDIKGIFDGIWKGIAAVIEFPINLIIDGINFLLEGVCAGLNILIGLLNKLSFDVPDWVTDLTGMETFGFNIPELEAPQISKFKMPLLATGAVIPPNAPFAAVLGDQKRGYNIEAPEALLRKIVREETGGNTSGGTQRFQIILDSKQIYEVVIENGRIVNRTTGRNPFALA